jgi:AraC-like DNA-binding protein
MLDDMQFRRDAIPLDEGDVAVSEALLPSRGSGALRLHTHDALEIFYFLSGSARQFFAHGSFDLHPGDIVICPPHLPHFAYAIGNGPARYGIILFKHSLIAAFSEGERFLAAFFCTDPAFNPHIAASEPYAGEMNQIIRRIAAADTGRSLHRKALLLQLLAFLAEWHESRHPRRNAAGMRPEILDVLLFMQQNAHRRIRLPELASRARLSRSRFEYLFHATMGTGPVEYLNRLRMLKAKNLLLEGATVTDAAFECGVEDCSRFSKLFRKYEKVSPMGWKKMHAFR